MTIKTVLAEEAIKREAERKRLRKRAMRIDTESEPVGEILTTKEAAVLLRIHHVTIERLLKAGKLPGFRLGANGHWRLRRRDLVDIISSDLVRMRACSVSERSDDTIEPKG